VTKASGYDADIEIGESPATSRKETSLRTAEAEEELSPNLGDGWAGQAAAVVG
jgi:hypothetical protein